jgi:hypothetical protein
MKILTFALVLLFACSTSEAPAQYTVRGKIVGVGAKLDIHHEAIPTYKHRDGKVRGMASMVMSFAPNEKTPPVVVGDLVTMTFTVHWDSDPGTRIVTLEKLPPDTKLALE